MATPLCHFPDVTNMVLTQFPVTKHIKHVSFSEDFSSTLVSVSACCRLVFDVTLNISLTMWPHRGLFPSFRLQILFSDFSLDSNKLLRLHQEKNDSPHAAWEGLPQPSWGWRCGVLAHFTPRWARCAQQGEVKVFGSLPLLLFSLFTRLLLPLLLWTDSATPPAVSRNDGRDYRRRSESGGRSQPGSSRSRSGECSWKRPERSTVQLVRRADGANPPVLK